MQDIYSGYGSKARIVMARYYTVIDHHFHRSSIVSTVDTADHARKRRFLAQGLTMTVVRSMEERIVKNVARLCASLQTEDTEAGFSEVDFVQLTKHFAFDAMTENVFGRSFETLASTANRWIVQSLHKAAVFPHVVRRATLRDCRHD